MNPDFTISMVGHALDNRPVEDSFRTILDGIHNGRWAAQVHAVREAYAHGGKDEASGPKKKLPGALFSGTFDKRSSEHLVQHSGLICIDLDDLGPSLEGTRDLIAQDPHTLAAFVSPTGTGLKVVFRCDPLQPHSRSFRAAERYVLENYGLNIDPACKDVARLCFVSHDPEALIAEDAEPLPYPPEKVEFTAPAPSTNGIHGLTPGDDYDLRSDVPSLLLRHQWTKVGRHGWRRPDKADGISATWDHVPNRFFVFSSSTAFEPNHVYRPWHVFALLECGGDFAKAAKDLYAQGFGERVKPKMQLESPEFEEAPAPGSSLRAPSSFLLPQDDDPNTLLGDRYLSRGDGAVLVGTSGMGKSSMSIQMAVLWALGLDFHGIKTAHPRRILMVQSEDSDGDVAEILHSIYHMLNLTDEDRAELDDRLKIVNERVYRGLQFFGELKKLIALHHPDIVFINPLQAFMDGDVTDARDLGVFLRERLNALNTPPSFAYMLVHHTTKPATGKDRADRLWHEVMYDMAGGAEIINWARAILSLRAAETEGTYNLVLAKRGRRAGVTRLSPQGAGFREESVTVIPLKHAGGFLANLPGRKKDMPIIFWEGRAADPKAAAKPSTGRPEKYAFNDYRTLMPPKTSNGLDVALLHRQLIPNGEIQKKNLQNVLKRWAEEGYVEIIDVPGAARRFRAAI